MTTETTLQNIQDAITALKDGWASTALNILEEARLDEMAKQQLMQAGIYPPGTQESVALRDALAEALTSVYVCGRVWEAWQYGTMSEGDFHPAAECNEVLDSLVEAVTKSTPSNVATPPAAPAQEPVAWKWHQAPVKTSWGDEMVVADLAIDKNHTVSVYCELDQTAKVEAMFTPPAAQRQWVGLTNDERFEVADRGDCFEDVVDAVEAKLKEKNQCK